MIRMLIACQAQHHRDPDTWHAKMLAPPAPWWSSGCQFCGLTWEDIAASLPSSEPKG